MAVYYALGFEVNTSATTVSSITGANWANRAPTYITYTGNSSTISIPSSGYQSSILTHQGKKYVVYPWDDSNDILMSGISGGNTTWAHNDTSANAHPDGPEVNFNNNKYVYIWNKNTPAYITYNGSSIPVFLFDCCWNNWITPLVNYGDTRREYHIRIQNAADVDKNYNVTHIDNLGTSFVEFYIEPSSFEDVTGRVELINSAYASTYSSSTSPISSTNVYDFGRKASTTTTYPVRVNSSSDNWKVFAIHNLQATTQPAYYISTTGGITTYPAHVSYIDKYNYKNVWGEYTAKFATDSKAHKYYSITTDSSVNGSVVLKEIPVELGKKYTFNLRTYSKASTSGIVLATTTQTYKTSISSYTGTSVLVTCHGTSGTNSNKTYTYTPSADGMLYLYFSSNGYGITTPENGNHADVEVIIEDAPTVTVTLNVGSSTFQTVSIAPGTAPEDYPTIELPIRAGYSFLGYFDDDDTGEAYYNSLGEGTKVFDKTANCTLYAHWQDTMVEVVFVNLNQNGGTGGQSVVAIKKNALMTEYPTVKIPARMGIVPYSFMGYWDGQSSSATQYITATGTGARTFNKTGNPTFYARWQNNTYFTPVNDGNIHTGYSPSSQTIKIANSFGANQGNVTYQIGTVGVSGSSLSASGGSMYLTIPAGLGVGFREFSIKITSTSSYTNNGYVGCMQTYYINVVVDKATPLFTLTGQSVGSGTAYVKATASVAGTVHWGTSYDTIEDNTVAISANTETTITSRNTTGTTKVYAYFVPNDTKNYINSGIKTAEAIRTSGVTITLNKNGGDGSNESFVIASGSHDWPTVNVPTRTGFTFLGYYDTSAVTGGTQYYYSTGTGLTYRSAPSSNTTLYARWQVDVTWDYTRYKLHGSVYCTDQAAAASTTQGSKTVSLSLDPISCAASSWTTTIDESGWTMTQAGTSVTIPSGTAAGRYYCSVTVTVQNGTNYVGCTKHFYGIVIDVLEVTLSETKYKDTNGNEGYNVTSSGIPTVNTNSYLSASNGGVVFTGTDVKNNISYYQRYTNGVYTSLQSYTNVDGPVKWAISSQTFTSSDNSSIEDITRFYGTTPISMLVNGQYIQVYPIERVCIHDSMLKNEGTDTVNIIVYNMDDPSKSDTVTYNTTNALGSTKYMDTDGHTGTNIVSQINPSVSIGSGITAAGGNAEVTCSSQKVIGYYRKYSSNEYTDLITETVTGTAYWVISSQSCVGGTDRYSYKTNAQTVDIVVGGNTITAQKSGKSIQHVTMTTNAGTDSVTVTAYDSENTAYSSTATVSVVNELLPTHYKNSTGTTQGNYSESWGIPTNVVIGSGMTAAGGSATVTLTPATCTDTLKFYKKYTSGSVSSLITEETTSTITLSLSTKTFTPTGGSASTTDRFTLSGTTITHSSMTTNAGTDKVSVKATNANNTSTTKTSSTSSITNSLGSTHYKNSSCTTEGDNITAYGTPTASIGGGITAAGGSATVSCSVDNSATWYQKYTSGSVTTKQSGTVSGSTTWSITTQTFTPTGGSASTITRFSKSSNTLSHTTMGTNAGTDYVKITAVNSGDSSKTKTADTSIVNEITWGDLGSITHSTPVSLAAAGQTYAMSPTIAAQTGTYTSGSTTTYNPTFGYAVKTAKTGFSLSSNNVTVSNNTSTSAREGYVVTITATGNGSKTTTKDITFNQAAGAKVYDNPVVSAYTYSTSVSAAGTTDLAPASCTCTHSYTWNNVSGSGGSDTYTLSSSGITWTFTNSGSISYVTSGTNFSTTGKINVDSRGSVIGNAQDFYSALSVVATIGGTSSASKTATAGKQVGNYVTAVAPRASGATTHFIYADIGAGDTNAPVTLKGASTYTYTSGATTTTAPGTTYGTATYSRTYTLETVQNGFTAVATDGTLTATNRGTETGAARTSGNVTSELTVTFVHKSTYSTGGTVVGTLTQSTTCTQGANTLTWEDLGTITCDTPITVPVTGEANMTMSPSIGTQTGTYTSGLTVSFTPTFTYAQSAAVSGFTLSSNKVTATNNTSASAKTYTVVITATGKPGTNSTYETGYGKTTTKNIVFNQAAGSKVYANPVVTGYSYATVGAVGGSSRYPTVTYTQSYTWNGTGSSTTDSYTYDSSHTNPGGSRAFTRVDTYSWAKAGTNFSTSGRVTFSSRGTTIGNERDAASAFSVVVTVNGLSSESFTCTSAKQVGNYLVSITPTTTEGFNSHFTYDNIGPGATSASPVLHGTATYTYTSGGTGTSKPGTTYGTTTYSRVYSLSPVQNGFTSVNETTGVLTATSYGTTVGPDRVSGTVTGILTVTFVHSSDYSAGGTITSSTLTTTATCTQTANALVSLSLTTGSNSIVYGSSTTGTVKATYTSGANQDVTSSSMFTTDPDDIVEIT